MCPGEQIAFSGGYPSHDAVTIAAILFNVDGCEIRRALTPNNLLEECVSSVSGTIVNEDKLKSVWPGAGLKPLQEEWDIALFVIAGDDDRKAFHDTRVV
jgi:hypothetical protein